MSARQRWKNASLMLCITAATVAAPLLAQDDRPAEKVAGGPAAIEVKPAKLKGVVRQQGWLERSKIVEVTCPVDGQTTIRSLVPHGTAVKAGDVVCELDRSALEELLRNQEIATRSAEATYRNAKLQREVAELALNEYTEGTAKQEEFAAQGAIDSARESLRSSEGRLERTQQAHKRVRGAVDALGGAKSPADIVAELDIEDRLALARLRVQHDQLMLEQNQTKKQVFQNFTRGKAIKELKSDIEKTKSDELTKEQLWGLQKLKEKKYRSEIAQSTIRAPLDGIVALRLPEIGSGARTAVAEGSTVRFGDTLLTISSGPLVVRTVLPNVLKDRIAVGNSARIAPISRTGAAIKVCDGVVEQIDDAPQVHERQPASAEKRVLVTIKMDKHPLVAEPALFLQVDITANEVDNALVVPPEAVLHRGGADYVAVVNPEGGIDWRSITLGARDATSVEIVRGIKRGESVVLRAAALLRGGGAEIDTR